MVVGDDAVVGGVEVAGGVEGVDGAVAEAAVEGVSNLNIM